MFRYARLASALLFALSLASLLGDFGPPWP
jgi:hypothetical protein